MRPRIRRYRDGDLGHVVRLSEAAGGTADDDARDVAALANLVTATDSVTLLAEVDEEPVGFAVGSTAGTHGRIHRVVARTDDLRAQLLEGIERRLGADGARTCEIVVTEDGPLHTALSERGYERRINAIAVQRTITGRDVELSDLGGRLVDPDLWDDLQGMVEVKEVIERRIILPLAEPDLARRHGVSAPQSVILFGPPGTGKTTFAKGVASRLRWPFVPIEIAQLSGHDQGAGYLSDTFDELLAASAAVAFFDEVEDIAADRRSERRVGSQVTNEFLRQLPRMRESPHHLLVCATNAVGDLDPAFLRPGRFDYVLPVGPPDGDARDAIWRRYVARITDEDVDVATLVEASDRFTPADIEFAARKAAQFAFEAAHDGSTDRRADTDQFLRAIEETPPTLTDEMLASFEDDVERYARS